MAHPDLLPIRQSGEQRRFRPAVQFERGQAELASFALCNHATEKMRHQLLAIADAKYGWRTSKDFRIDRGAGRVVNAGRTAGNDQALAPRQFSGGGLAGAEFRVYSKIR